MQKRRSEAFLKGRKMLQRQMCNRKEKLRSRTAWSGKKENVRLWSSVKRKAKSKEILRNAGTQFRNLFDKATKKAGKTGENLLILLETRLDNVVFRLGFAASRKEARQLVTHGHFTVNGKKANIPSMEVKAGDVIAVKAKSQSSPKFKEIKEMSITVPSWMTVDVDKLEGKVVTLPTREEIDTPIAEHLIVELYSK